MQLLSSLLALTLLASAVAGDFYSAKYDHFDIQPLLENDRILVGYTRCFLDRGPCTPDARDFKKVIPEALQTVCGKCTPRQKQLIKTVVQRLMERRPDAWAELVERYDAEQQYRETFYKFLRED